MKNLVNSIKKHGLSIFAMTLLLGYGGYSYAKSMFSTPWYEITSMASNPNDDQLGSSTPDPTSGGECDFPEEDIRCAVQFNNPNNHDLTNQNRCSSFSIIRCNHQ
ncbi:Uncharacterised protein [Sphingobacterium multivorum]|uniref:Uncharacterized protein n=1 Tax=Sphingobacterium multivorum TaxID=28454 RepID=A0A2X2J940_SPHMU|nr:hypothetical protein [Sphingobacterium multivorum]SPZ83555.1 Uncharacterised protein [Sphingobacterium multivorum]